jgi:hypothetical protein
MKQPRSIDELYRSGDVVRVPTCIIVEIQEAVRFALPLTHAA